jgi:type III pantothenate kinase
MSITLCFDFGNTRKKVAVFENDQLKEAIVLADDHTSTVASLIEKVKPTKSILSSVIDHNPEVEFLLKTHTQFHKLSHLTKIAFTTPVGKPETIGADRLALCAAAVHFFPKANNLVIGLGSCITYNFINKNHGWDLAWAGNAPKIVEPIYRQTPSGKAFQGGPSNWVRYGH